MTPIAQLLNLSRSALYGALPELPPAWRDRDALGEFATWNRTRQWGLLAL